MQSVLPAATPLWPVGGVAPGQIAGWKAAGASGAGIGGALFTPGVATDELARRAQAFAAAWRTA
jgi:2-dehydro-3-deoxyphosphogalactonate aldolase